MKNALITLGFSIIIALTACQSENEASAHLWHDFPAINENGLVNAVIEIPAGSDKKYEVNKISGQAEWEVLKNGEYRIIHYLAYPANYGMIPQTYLPESEGGDGDPLDIIILGPAYERGSVVPCKLIGVLLLKDHGETDDKLIAVSNTSAFAHINNLDELERQYPGIKTILSTWFTNYKGKNKMHSDGWAEKEEAQEILNEAITAYKKEIA
ncbi:MAG: inorganic diphosphatase [Bacteroidales bacterium]|jgi:inorganic pyrophosphatase|nr:inorganic diphosphatase [Bacteroidales bacterium]